jgi:hypothetical protein
MDNLSPASLEALQDAVKGAIRELDHLTLDTNEARDKLTGLVGRRDSAQKRLDDLKADLKRLQEGNA